MYRALYSNIIECKTESSRKLQSEFQELRKRYWEQHLWARGYFVVTSGQISAKDVQKYIDEQKNTSQAG